MKPTLPILPPHSYTPNPLPFLIHVPIWDFVPLCVQICGARHFKTGGIQCLTCHKARGFQGINVTKICMLGALPYQTSPLSITEMENEKKNQVSVCFPCIGIYCVLVIEKCLFYYLFVYLFYIWSIVWVVPDLKSFSADSCWKVSLVIAFLDVDVSTNISFIAPQLFMVLFPLIFCQFLGLILLFFIYGSVI